MLNSSEQQSSVDVTPAAEDHLVLHFNDYIFHPAMAEVWSQNYAEELAKFITEHADEADKEASRAIAKLVLSPDWKKGNDSTILSDLHIAEAEVRGVSQWTLQEVLWMQERLCNHGLMSAEHMVNGRQEILELIGHTNCDQYSLEEIGARTAGLSLCLSDVWMLNKVSPELAGQLQEKITSECGASYYASKVMWRMGQNRRNNEMIDWSQKESDATWVKATEIRNSFVDQLPTDVKVGMLKAFRDSLGATFSRSMKEKFGDIKEQIEELGGRIKSKLKSNNVSDT